MQSLGSDVLMQSDGLDNGSDFNEKDDQVAMYAPPNMILPEMVMSLIIS